MSSILIIGSGIGGLTAGNLLARRGHKVTIFESHHTPGGYTAGFMRKGFYFESGTFSFEGSRSVFKAMKDLGIFEKIGFVRQESRFISDEFDCLSDSYENFKEVIYSSYKDEKQRITRYFNEVDRFYRAMLPLISAGNGSKQNLFASILGAIRIMMQAKKYSNMNIDQFTERYFDKDTRLYNLFKSFFGYPEMSAHILGGAIVTLFNDYWTVKDGIQHWANVLAEAFEMSRNKLLLQSPVDTIRTRNGAAVGVVSRGTMYDADYVISAGDYKNTFLELLDDKSKIPDSLMGRIQHNAVSEGVFTVYLGLSIPHNTLQKYMKVPHVLIQAADGTVNIHDSEDMQYFKKSSYLLYSPSLHNPALAPEDSSSLMLQAMAPSNWMNNWGGGDKKIYTTLKEGARDTFVERASEVIHGLRSHIMFKDAATPLTYERYTHNTNGATSAWSWNPQNKFYKNILSTHVKTPVRNLLIGSCWATQIGGVPSAIEAAYRCVKQIH